MKLELKDIDVVGYLPYRLKVEWLREDDKLIVNDLTISDYNFLIKTKKAKPILHPLSDIMKSEFLYIWANEVDFKSMEQCILLDNESFMSCKFSYYFWEELYKKKIDFQGLIKKGLAISIHDV